LVQDDLNAARAAIATATVDNQAQSTAWVNWMNYARECWINPWMQALPHKTIQANLLHCLCHKGSLWNLWEHNPSWTPICGKGAASHGANVAFWLDTMTPEDPSDPKS
jgi:hypothetical protein